MSGESDAQPHSNAGGLDTTELLFIPEQEQQLLTWLIRHGPVSLTDMEARMSTDPDGARALLETVLS